LGSGEGKQVFRPEGGEVDRESWESKLPTCWLLLAMLLVVEVSGAASTKPGRREVVGILVLFIVVALIVKRFGQSHDRWCGPCIAI